MFYQPLEIFEYQPIFIYLFIYRKCCVLLSLDNFQFVFVIILVFTFINLYYFLFLKKIISLNSLNMFFIFLSKFIFTLIKNKEIFRLRRFFLFFYTIFVFILVLNMLGLIPFSLAITSHLFFIFILSSSVFVGFTVYGFLLKSYFFLSIFIPQNVPQLLLPFLVFIEVISYFSRFISLSVRLFANVVSGHVLIYILSGGIVDACRFLKEFFLLQLFSIPLSCIFAAIVVMEVGIAFLQAYVFLTLSLIYSNDIF